MPADALAQLYVRTGLVRGKTGKLLGVSFRVVLRAAHDQGLPVRIGGVPPHHGPTEIELVDALYDDPLVQQTLSASWPGQAAPGGPIWQRFPVPLRVDAELAEELYVACGVGLRHIELLCGQPGRDHSADCCGCAGEYRCARPAAASPFLRRWRTGPLAQPSADQRNEGSPHRAANLP